MNVTEALPLADSWGMHGDVGAGWMVGMMVVMALVWGAIVLGAVWLVRAALDGRQAARREPALDVLQRRFAEGALSAEDYRARRAVLVSEEHGAGTERPAAPPASTS